MPIAMRHHYGWLQCGCRLYPGLVREGELVHLAKLARMHEVQRCQVKAVLAAAARRVSEVLRDNNRGSMRKTHLKDTICQLI